MTWRNPLDTIAISARRCRALLWATSCLTLAAVATAHLAHAAPAPHHLNAIDTATLQQGGQGTRDFAALWAASRDRTAVATGDTYGLAAAGFDGDGTNGKWVANAGGVVLPFDGGTFHEIDASFYGNAGDSMYVFESTYQLADQRVEVVIEVLAFDSNFNLTNWFADGSEAAPGVPFERAAVNLGDFNAPLDKLNLGSGSNQYVLESAAYWFIGSEGSFFGPSGEPFQWFDTSSAEGISGSADIYFGSDIATTSFQGQEFTGFSMSFVLAPLAVPEPSSMLLLTPLALLGGRRRR